MKSYAKTDKTIKIYAKNYPYGLIFRSVRSNLAKIFFGRNIFWPKYVLAKLDVFNSAELSPLDVLSDRCLLDATIGPDMHETKCRGARDPSVVKFSAPYDACRSTKRRKNETEKFRKIANFERPFTPETMLRLASNLGKMRFR